MIRYFLARGDRGGSATITEGLESVTCSNPPPSVQIATLYMKTYCTACKREGFTSPKGPRLPGRAPNGQPWALSGDINACGCSPPPVFYAERGMRMILTSHELVESAENGRGPEFDDGERIAPDRTDIPLDYDEQVRVGIGTTLPQNYPNVIETVDGRTYVGRVGTDGQLPRVNTEAAGSYTIYWGEDALAHRDWTSCPTDR
ncbi:hypothetical protein BLA14095_03444 [Burkholderia lata]|uniref:hypothetical protein n=1 Tax=Burkholderia lata (strain ATCC 17760 / DSM 23089 / LMG 22485 / NCIMB 9086 / R18194 / 383) TaxID=482957 RepID=UPI001453D100|nr:hypothetical protein [Burkholderia lata]VWB75124.1 hypothetical protein BLA14095_03444 [Burkholderia lata]